MPARKKAKKKVAKKSATKSALDVLKESEPMKPTPVVDDVPGDADDFDEFAPPDESIVRVVSKGGVTTTIKESDKAELGIRAEDEDLESIEADGVAVTESEMPAPDLDGVLLAYDVIAELKRVLGLSVDTMKFLLPKTPTSRFKNPRTPEVIRLRIESVERALRRLPK